MQIKAADNQKVVVSMSVREAGKIRSSLDALATIPPVLKPLVDVLAGIAIPNPVRGELRYEWGDPLDMDADIGPD